MKSIILLLIVVLPSLQVTGQKLFLAHESYNSIEKMKESMPAIARQEAELLRTEHPKNEQFYYGYLFRFELIAGNNKKAIDLIDSLRRTNSDEAEKSTNAFPFFVYAEVLRRNSNIASGEVIRSVINEACKNLSPAALESAENYFKSDLASRQENFLLFAARKVATGSDSLTYDEAKNLCFVWLNYVAYTAIHDVARVSFRQMTLARYFIEDSVMITMRDGARLSATIVRSRTEKSQPVIVKLDIYSSASQVSSVKSIALRGYAGVIVDTRGKRLGSGPIIPFEHDATDAWDVIDWISRQKWCDGNVGMFGGSYLGFTTWAACKKVHPALKAIVPLAAVAPGIDFPNINGVGWTGSLQWLHLIGDNKVISPAARNDRHWDSIAVKLYQSGKKLNSMDSLEGRPNMLFQKYVMHQGFDKYWQRMIPNKDEFTGINIPVLSITGYYDDDQLGALYYFKQHYLYNKNAQHWLVIGPWDHGQSQEGKSSRVINYDIDPVASINLTNLVFEWFDHILKKRAKPDILKERVNFQVMGSNTWRHTTTLTGASTGQRYFLSSKKRETVYSLDIKKPQRPALISIHSDVTDRNKESENKMAAINGEGNIILDSIDEKETLMFCSELFKESTELTGFLNADLRVVSNQPDFSMRIGLYEQFPDGRLFQLSNNILQASWLTDPSRQLPLHPGKLERLRLHNTFFTSKKINAGSKIIMTIGVLKNHLWAATGSGLLEIKIQTGSEVSFK